MGGIQCLSTGPLFSPETVSPKQASIVCKMPCLVAIGKDSGGAGTEMGFMDISYIASIIPEAQPSPLPSGLQCGC